MSLWVIEATPEGKFDVTRDRRHIAYDREDLEEAMRSIQWHPSWSRGDSVELLHLDGYREPVRL